MCGITGILEFGGNTRIDPAVLQRMAATIVHRGPDDEGFHVDRQAGLAIRRLSIIDPGAGHQPIGNEDGSLWIVFNGEIYNHSALRPQLESRGHVYRTHCDTETILHLYEEYGTGCLEHLRGMFAFAIWDARSQKLFLARDRMGIKPLYYRLTPERLIFASEIKAILAHPGVVPQLNRRMLPEYLAFGYLSGQDTIYSGIRKLMPGHWMEVSANGALRLEPYWDLHLAIPDPTRAESDYSDIYRRLLQQSVESHLMSDVALGVFLSGGVDSSAIASLVTQTTGSPVRTFSVGYREDDFSELLQARTVASHLKSDHHEVRLTEQDFFDALPHLIWHEDEPIVWPSSIPLYFVARLARNHVKVVLTGEGADETLAGYTRYAFTLKNASWDRIYRRLTPEALRRATRNAVGAGFISASLRRKLSHTFLARDGESWESLYFDNFFSAFSADQQSVLFSDHLSRELEGVSPYTNILNAWTQSSGEPLQRMLYTDIKTYLVELLMKQDNMSMAASVESRVPFLDHTLAEFAIHIPQHLQVGGFAGKRILKKAVADLLPREILDRPKLGFPTPWSRWLQGSRLDVIGHLLHEPRSVERGLFRPGSVERLLHEHRSRRCDHADRIWRLLNLELWQRICLEGDEHLPPEISERPA